MKSAFETFVSYLLCDWVASVGAVITTTSAVVFLTFAFQDFANPYFGIVVFLILPALFLLGLVLIPLGVWRCSRRQGGMRNIPRVDLAGARTLQFVALIAILTIVNVAIISAATFNGVQYMDSNEFCGTVCHTVMTPQYVTYQTSPHSRVHCVSCHIGSGTEAFVHYKLNGVRQLFSLTLDTYPRPIPPAMRTLRPAAETCEGCHRPDRPAEDKLKIVRRYDEDEASTEKTSVLMMRTGSRIHKAHAGRNIEYIARDAANQEIPWVSVDGAVYKTADATGERQRMDCRDCHNRSGHDFDTPASAMDKALASGELDRSMPFAKRDAILALTGKKPLEEAPAGVKAIYQRYVYPEMMISWGAYPNNIGHDAFPGCFRCHDDNHKSEAGKTISQDCGVCHELLAVAEESPEILKQLGLQ
jgi:nitrate/TMAO reductase-like tetraheme cytochrome c subunit